MNKTCHTCVASVDFPAHPLVDGFDAYAPDVVWRAPRRGIRWEGRSDVMSHLLLEIAAMQALRVTPLRRSVSASQIIDEFSARFVYAGSGIEGIELPSGADVDLERLRILTLTNGLIAAETCIETWTVLGANSKPLLETSHERGL